MIAHASETPLRHGTTGITGTTRPIPVEIIVEHVTVDTRLSTVALSLTRIFGRMRSDEDNTNCDTGNLDNDFQRLSGHAGLETAFTR